MIAAIVSYELSVSGIVFLFSRRCIKIRIKLNFARMPEKYFGYLTKIWLMHDKVDGGILLQFNLKY